MAKKLKSQHHRLPSQITALNSATLRPYWSPAEGLGCNQTYSSQYNRKKLQARVS